MPEAMYRNIYNQHQRPQAHGGFNGLTQSRYPAELFMPPMPIAPAQRQTGQREGFIMSKEVDLPESSRTNNYN
tara:strand:- start:24 stop:242 length:219 start_codon:yes stop_codon:yes gene_type:complete